MRMLEELRKKEDVIKTIGERERAKAKSLGSLPFIPTRWSAMASWKKSRTGQKYCIRIL